MEDDIELNSYNNITNNTITRPDGESDITYGITLTGHDNLIANNIVNIYGQGITTQWGYTDPATPQIGDNSERYKGNFYINNTVNNAASFRATNNSTVENNTLTGTVITGANSTFVNNTISAKVTAQTGSSLYNNTIFDGVLINTKNVRLIGNNISKTVNMTKNDVYLEHNHICGYIKIKNGLSNITVINNILCAGFYENSQPTTVSNNTHCGSDCTANTCMCSHTILNANKNLKQDDNDTILITADNVDDYYEIYNADGDLVSDSGGKPYEVCPISSVERANRGKTYLIDSSAIAKMGHGSSYLSSGYVNIVGVGKPTIRVNSMGIMSHFSNFTIKLIADPEDEEYLPNLRFSVGQNLTEDITYENLSIIYDLETTTTSIVNLTKFGKVYGYNSSDFEIRNTLTLRNSEIKCSFPTENINWGSVNRPYIVPVVIPKGVSNVTIENCNITLEELSYGKNYSTLWGIYNLQNNTKIINNNISISGQKYLYAIENAVSNTNISNNNIVVNGTHYTAGVYISGTNMQNNTVENNNITLYSGYGHAGDNGLEEDSGYAVVIEDRSYGGYMYRETQGSDVYNNRIINNNITSYGNNPYSIEQFGGKNTTIAGNNITAVGCNPAAIALTGVNCLIENNTIVSLAQTNVTGTTVDHFPAVSAGVYLQYSYNTTVKNNNITGENCTAVLTYSYDALDISKNNILSTDDYAVTLNKINNSFVTENNIQARTLRGDSAVTDNDGNNNVIENNTPDSVSKYDTMLIFLPDDEYDIAEDMYFGGEIVYGEDETPLNGEDLTITITFSDDTQLTATVTTDESGSFNYTFDKGSLIEGEATIKVDYAGNDNYNPTSEEYSTTIISTVEPPKETQIQLMSGGLNTLNVSNQKVISGYFCVKGSMTGTYVDLITVYDNGEEIGSVGPTDNWGTIAFRYNATTPGEHNITFKYAGNESYLASEATVTLVVLEPPKEYSLQIDTTEFTPGTTATIQASIYYGNEYGQELANINKGKVSFKVNGKTLKDANGKVIYAKVTNGTATITDYSIPESWKEGSTIQAIYSGSSDLAKMSSEKENITITYDEITITTEDITTAASSTITLKATINTNAVINTGKVVFKINGKTVKDANGKVIYAKVINNTVSVEYTLPEDMVQKDYNITAVFISPDYDRIEDTKTLSITA